MNYLILSFLFAIFRLSLEVSAACDTTVTDLYNNKVNVDSFCTSKKPCVVKCCGENEVIHTKHKVETCMNVDVLKEKLGGDFSGIHFDYSDLLIYKNDLYKSLDGVGVVSSMKMRNFTWLQSKSFSNLDSCTKRISNSKLIEEGTLMYFKANRYEHWLVIKTPKFCVDMMVGLKKNTNKPIAKYIFRLIPDDEKSSAAKNYFTAIAMLISAFFLLLVLVVYCILHQLRNIQGMLLTAYVATLMCTYGLKAFYLLYSDAEKNSDKGANTDCTVISQITYFLILASFFWLKLMSFDIWWTFRGTRKLRQIHRRGINIKFMIYASYAYGVPAAMTVFAAIMDKRDLPPNIIKPLFSKCFVTDTVFVYLYIPLMILTGCNCLLFLMTMYNIWLIRKNMSSFDKSTVQKTKKNQNTFFLYIKLSSLMGVSWILEFTQIRMSEDAIPVWLYILINSFNVFIGVIIFFLFVFKTSIFMMLCKRFNIENRWTRQHYKVTNSTRSEFSKSSKNYSRSYSRTRSTTDSDVDDGTAIKKNEERMPLKKIDEANNGSLDPEFTPPGVNADVEIR